MQMKESSKNKMTKQELVDLLEAFAADIVNGIAENDDDNIEVLHDRIMEKADKFASSIIENFSNK